MTHTGIWDTNEAEHHVFSIDLANNLLNTLNERGYVIDMGCGRGDYLRFLQIENNWMHCIGIEGTTLKEHADISVLHKDLSEPFYIHAEGDVISFEVGEHIPQEYEQVFLDNLAKHCVGKLVLSWAVPGQGGIGHVNCQPQDYIIKEIERRGLWFNPVETAQIRNGEYENAPWFKETLMVFNR